MVVMVRNDLSRDPQIALVLNKVDLVLPRDPAELLAVMRFQDLQVRHGILRRDTGSPDETRDLIVKHGTSW